MIGCDAQTNKIETTESNHDLFIQLAVVEAGLDFPGSVEKLETCRRVQDDPCLRSYESFSKAKAILLQKPQAEALKLTLKNLGEFCKQDPPTNFKNVCTGTLIALYFFTEDQEDKEIRLFLSQLPTEVRENVLEQSVSMNVSWLSSRTDNKAWRSWLGSENVDTMVITNAIRRLESSEQISKPIYEVIQGR